MVRRIGAGVAPAQGAGRGKHDAHVGSRHMPPRPYERRDRRDRIGSLRHPSRHTHKQDGGGADEPRAEIRLRSAHGIGTLHLREGVPRRRPHRRNTPREHIGLRRPCTRHILGRTPDHDRDRSPRGRRRHRLHHREARFHIRPARRRHAGRRRAFHPTHAGALLRYRAILGIDAYDAQELYGIRPAGQARTV